MAETGSQGTVDESEARAGHASCPGAHGWWPKQGRTRPLTRDSPHIPQLPNKQGEKATKDRIEGSVRDEGVAAVRAMGPCSVIFRGRE